MAVCAPPELQEEWKRLAPVWTAETRAGRNVARTGLLDKIMIETCGDVRGLVILDSGCGEGRFCRMLVNLGVRHAVGVDLRESMIKAARELAMGRDPRRRDSGTEFHNLRPSEATISAREHNLESHPVLLNLSLAEFRSPNHLL